MLGGTEETRAVEWPPHMTVAELRKVLDRMPDEARCVVGYDGAYLPVEAEDVQEVPLAGEWFQHGSALDDGSMLVSCSSSSGALPSMGCYLGGRI
jgi:hypothetical protein